MAGFRMMTWRYWAFVVGVIAPLFGAAIHTYVVMGSILGPEDEPVTPLYSVALGLGMGVPVFLVVGLFLSYALRRPQAAGPRFLVGLAVGFALLLVAQTGAIKF